MSSIVQRRFRDLLLRLIGAAVLAVGLGAMRWLFGSVAPGVPADPSLGQFLAAALGFVALSLGAVFIVLGAHLFDRIDVSDRWTDHGGPSDLEPPHDPAPSAASTGAFSPPSSPLHERSHVLS